MSEQEISWTWRGVGLPLCEHHSEKHSVVWSEIRRSVRFDSAGFIFKVYIKLKTLIGASLFKTHIYIYFEKKHQNPPRLFSW